MQIQGTNNSQNNPEKEQSWKFMLSNFQIYNNQHSIVLA